MGNDAREGSIFFLFILKINHSSKLRNDEAKFAIIHIRIVDPLDDNKRILKCKFP